MLELLREGKGTASTMQLLPLVEQGLHPSVVQGNVEGSQQVKLEGSLVDFQAAFQPPLQESLVLKALQGEVLVIVDHGH